ncbi:hypothetical protein [Celeribacter marinus]|uniref:hypothetical protein n=1 Tax=Celeribacter marinus TaxID=1397108 RepID=UPI000785AF44|nr:hypothetical protein [Celeribacter marinus]SFK08409.1 hypothetical protein SAMN05444421_101370 [Celeribacter marinus]
MKILAYLFAASVLGLVVALMFLVSGQGIWVALIGYMISGIVSFVALLVRLERHILPKVVGERSGRQA